MEGLIALGEGRYQVLGGDTFPPNTGIRIDCPITNLGSFSARVKVKLQIYEGSAWVTHGTKLAEYTSSEKTVAAGATASFSFSHTTEEGTIDRRDVGVVVLYWDGSAWVEDGSHEWDDLYYVSSGVYQFEIGAPVVSQA